MRHAFGIDPLSCRRCPERMRFVNVVFDAREVKRLLSYLRCFSFSDPLLIHPARGPPEHAETFDFPCGTCTRGAAAHPSVLRSPAHSPRR